MMIVKGDLVRHPVLPLWGIGKVLKTFQGGNLLVRFEGAGEKLLHPGYAALEKLHDDDILYLVIRGVRVKRGRSVPTIRVIPVVKQNLH